MQQGTELNCLNTTVSNGEKMHLKDLMLMLIDILF